MPPIPILTRVFKLLVLGVFSLALAGETALGDSETYAVYSNGLIPPPPAELFTWSDPDCTPTYNATNQDPTAPQGTVSFLSSGSSCAWFGWGVFLNMNMSAYSNGQISFFLKSTTSLEVQLQDQQGNKPTVLTPSTDGQWQQMIYPVSTFTSQGVDLSAIYGLFLITDTNGPTTFYLDDVVWSNNVIPQTGSLQVTISPASAITAGAKWQVDGGKLQNSGATVTNLSVSDHTVSFSTVAGWRTPSNQIIAVIANSTATVSGNYVAIGSLEVTLEPVVAITAGAQWQVDDGTFQNSGATVSNLSVGDHWVSFSTISGWTTPTNETVSIKANAVAKTTGTYTYSAQGTYNGLFAQADINVGSSGMLMSLSVTASGTYSGKLLIGGSTNTISGGFTASGQASNNVPRLAIQGGPLTLEMKLNWNDSPPSITGTVLGTNGGPWIAGLTAELASNSLGSADYTVLLLSSGTPPGYGYLLITNHAGTVTLNGALADGTAFSQVVPASGAGDLPVYGNLYSSTGLLLGWIGLETGSPTGNLTWIKEASRSSTLYTNGFTNLVLLQGSPWIKPSPHTAAIDLPLGQLDFSGGGLVSALSFNVAVSNNNALVKLTGSPTNSLTGSINTNTGLLTITFGNGAGKATTAGIGAVLQNANSAGGYFLGKTNAGSIFLQP